MNFEAALQIHTPDTLNFHYVLDLSVSKFLNFTLLSPSRIAPNFYCLVEQCRAKFHLGLKQIVFMISFVQKLARGSVSKQSKLVVTDLSYCLEQKFTSLVSSPEI